MERKRMKMNQIAIQTSIVSLFERYPDMSVEEIASDRNVSVDFVRATLMTKSEVFRNVHKAKEAKKEFISESELHEFYDNYKALARYTENDAVKEKCLAKLIDDGRGRLDKKEEAKGANVTNNLNIITVMLERAKANKEIVLNPAPQNELIEA